MTRTTGVPLWRSERFVNRVGVVATVLASFAACKRSESQPKPTASGVPAPVASGVPISPAVISKAVNPKGEQPYSGATATVRGTVRIVGDPSPDQPQISKDIPDGCARAKETYAKVFREGPGRTVADVFVAVTGYQGYVPSTRQAVAVEAEGCAFSTRTVGLTLGERIDVVAKDRRAYVPDLLGGRVPVQLIALPGTNGTLYPEQPGRYQLVDSMRIFARAEVLVVKYATFDVTKLDGKFVIARVPVGKVKVNAILPSTLGTVEREIVLEEGKEVDLNLEIRFNEADYRAQADAAAKARANQAPAPAPSR